GRAHPDAADAQCAATDDRPLLGYGRRQHAAQGMSSRQPDRGSMSRADAIERSLAYYDDETGGYFADLARYVAVPSESQNPARLPDLERYLETVIKPALEPLGYACKVFPNPIAGCGPVMLASRVEDPALPTFLCYGHGDVVLGMEGRWDNNRDPWTLSFEGDRVYGRGT